MATPVCVQFRQKVGHFYETYPILCSDDTCGPFIPGTHIMPYSAVHSGPDDPPHYNADGPEYIWRFFCSQFNEWGLLP